MKRIFLELELCEKLLVMAVLFSIFSFGVIIGQNNDNNGWLFIISCFGPFIAFGLVGFVTIITDRS